jgi:hypothetical protein
MKKLVLALALALVGTPAFAQHIGPASTAGTDLKPVIGVGYDYHQAQWDGADVQQNRTYVHIGVGGGIANEPRYELYLNLGAADLKIDNYGGTDKFDANFQPFGGAGLKINFLRPDLPWGLGLVAQGAYFGAWDDKVGGMNWKIRNAWEIEGAIPIEYSFQPFIVYAGPVLFGSRAKLRSDTLDKRNFEEDDNFGAFGGIAAKFGPLRIEAEVQQKSDTSLSGLLTYSF